MKKVARVPGPALSRRALPKRSIGEDFGQHERLTTRLNRLLEDYTDGFSVLKELVQNADDAGATEVRFLYDERTNEDAMTYLLDEGMKECQGPALWVYNDAVFRDEDFQNIEKLSGATKEHDTEKIGKFGLGFNAVYNLTDVPMFLSRNYFVVLDPHRSYLGEAIQKNAKPGIKIDLKKDAEDLGQCRDQFKPFNGIFGCDVHLHKEDNSFDGTLFRFPLRTKEQAIRSEIKQLYYNDHEMRELLQMLLDGAESLLIFTQNVLRMGIYNLPKCSSKNPQPSLLFQVAKSVSEARIQRELPFRVTLPTTAEKLSRQEQSFLEQCNFLQVASQFTKFARDHDADPKQFPKSTLILNIDCNFTDNGLAFFNFDPRCKQKKVTWLVSSSMGNGQAMQFIKDNDDTSLVPSAGVAIQLVPIESDGTFLPSPVVKNVDGLDVNGTVFCYLPLPIHSGLPVHINGAFAVASNRRHLQEKLEDDKSCYGVKWNEVLMQDSVCSAFLSLLEDVKSLVPDGDWYKFHLLWPTTSNVHHNCWPLMTSFYNQVAKGHHSLFSDGLQWVDINNIFFLDPEFRRESQVGDASFKVFQMLYGNNNVIIDLPLDVLKSFEKCGLKNEINARSYSKSRFFRECFFKNISEIVPAALRDVLTLHALDNFSEDVRLLLKQHDCIPVSPSGQNLKCPSQLVNPDREVASLFCPGDGRFPFGNQDSYLNFQRLAKLEQLGMVSDDLEWSEIAERAESIQTLNAADHNAALKRVKLLLTFMDKKLKRRHQPKPASCQRLLKAKFLPVLKKPANFPLPWKGDVLQGSTQVLLAPEQVFLEEEKYRVCCTQPLVGVFIPKSVQVCLKLDKRHATLDHVMQQLQQAMSARINALDDTEYEELSRVCTAAYSYLQNAINIYGDKSIEYVRGKSFILVGRRFLSAQQVAFKLTADCSPYLFKLPQHLANAFRNLMKAAGVKDMFDGKDYISTLHEVKKHFGETKLDKHSLQITIHLAVQLAETLKASKIHPSEVQEKWGTVYLPDSNGMMRPVSDLCIRNCPWMPGDASVRYVNDKIPWPACSQVGVKTRREEALKRHSIGMPWGQKEKLTNRLKRILTGYPCEKEILKELLQNADDAQATEVCFIKDPRQHPKQRVFEDSWQSLQGPALCVYNNKPFTYSDIEGIQNLGEGSKGDDPNKTGQYGVGFNAVYHLTDAPSFISKGEDIGDVLCVFDPNCKYAPGASPDEPGRMFIVDKTLETDFPDVFPCFLGEHFPRDKATMFRFPLRTEQMARESKISSSPVSLRKLDAMMEELKKELFEVLLFVNNVKKITLCEVNETGKNLVNAYTVEAAMSKEDEAKRKAFSDYIKQIGKLKNEKEVFPTKVPVQKVSYVLNIKDTLGNEEKWLIVQQMGFEKSVERSIVDAFKLHQLGMLPRGGVACLLETRNSRDPMQRRKKAYCFLPLPFETNLPVHINGHFALDHEARRNLWRDETGRGGYRTDWNNALLRDVVASCYVTLLVEVREFIKLPITQGATPYAENDILQKISVYETFFPLQATMDRYWKTLVDSVYQEINRTKLQILPVVRKRPLNVEDSIAVVEVTWLPPTGSGRQRAFFNNLAETGPFKKSPHADENQDRLRKKFEAILLESNFNLVAFSMRVHDSFQRSDVATCSVSSSSVIDFYRTFSSQDPLCTIGTIPCDVAKTVFDSAFGVILVLLYCKCAENFLDKLPDLPLLLTQDNCLQLFSSRQPKILSRYHDLLPRSPQIFLHELLDRNIFSGVATRESSVLKPLDAQIFATNLPQTLPCESYKKAAFVKWAPEQKEIPNQRWISRLWHFLYELVGDVLSDANIDEDSKIHQIKAVLGPLFNWSILPVTETRSLRRQAPLSRSLSRLPLHSEHLLAPLKHAASVLDFRNPDSSSRKLVDVLRKLGLPELNCAPLSSTSSVSFVYSPSDSVTLAGALVSSLKVPSSLLASLDQKMVLDPRPITERLERSACRIILEYFSRSVSCLKETDMSTLRKLPFYLATRGGFISLDDAEVCVLPIGIPREGINVLEHELGVVFVESWESISDLFKFLELECVSAVDVYCTYILTNFPSLSGDARQVHLEYILSSILADFVTKDGEKQRVLESLRNTSLLPSEDGTLLTASCFYDPSIDVFHTMLPDSNFPSEPFNSSEWITFLRRIGLVHEVSSDRFKRFATELAHEAATARTERTYEKSEVLVRHLISRHDVVSEGLLQSVRDIPFVAADPVSQPLRELCPPLLETDEDELPFISFQGAVFADHEEIVWTKAHLLPQWANPTCRRYELGCPPRTRIDNYCNAFLLQLQVLKTPSVDLVVRHCQAICSHLDNSREWVIASPSHCSTVVTVMEHIYRFLQEHAMGNNEAKNLLKATPCILVERGRKFIMTSQAVMELYEDREIKPFLYKVPPEFGTFQRLFEYLGCSKSVGATHYAMVLEKLRENCQNVKLHPNELIMCSKAVKGFFERLQEDPKEAATLSELYLPAMSPKQRSSGSPLNTIPVTLHRSNELVFDDAPAFQDRILGLELLFVLELSLMEVGLKSARINYKELMMKLPALLQPVMLSSVVKEKLADGLIVTSGAVTLLMQRLSSPQFGRGIVRIMRDVTSQKKDFDEQRIANIEQNLQSIKLYAVESLQTVLVYNGHFIPGSETEVRFFKEKHAVAVEETCTVYVNVGKEMDDGALARSLVSDVIVEICGELLGRYSFLIPEMLRCPLSDIWPLLDRTGIRQDDSCKAAEMVIYPEPGTFIPIEDHHLLNDAFVEFEPGEYVGYQLDDPSLQLEEGVATYIYAVIIEEVVNEDDILELLTKKYLINIGHDKQPVMVNTANLHKFHRLQEISECPQNRNRQVVFGEISEVLEDAWTLPEEERRQIVKRLILRWHPEKNVGDEEFCSGAFEHIKNEISRLGGSYDEYIEVWVARAREHGSHREEYRERFVQQYGSWESSSDRRSWQNFPPSFSRRNPQPGEARRWFRQAEADLLAGANEIDSNKPSYEWACFKCHQVELALLDCLTK